MGKLLNILRWAFAGLFVAIAAALVFFSLPVTGWKALTVQTGSMEPTIPVGSLVFVQSVPTGSLQPGDVITYKSKEKPENITHRVIEKQGQPNGPKQYITKGDANHAADAPVSEIQVVGKVTYAIPIAGQAVDFLRTPLGLALFVYVPALVLFIYELRLLVKRLTQFEVERQKQTTPAVLQPVPIAVEAPTNLSTDEPVEPEPAPVSPSRAPAQRKRPRIIDGLSVLLVGVLLATASGTTRAALNTTATLTGNTIAVSAPVPKVLIWRVNFPGAPDATTSFQPIVFLYNPVRGTVPDLEGWRLESSSGLVFGFRGPTPLYARNRFFDVHSGPSGFFHTQGDYLILKDKTGNVVDAISWGSDTSKLSPSIQGVATRRDILRNDPAVDTGTAADWHVQNED